MRLLLLTAIGLVFVLPAAARQAGKLGDRAPLDGEPVGEVPGGDLDQDQAVIVDPVRDRVVGAIEAEGGTEGFRDVVDHRREVGGGRPARPLDGVRGILIRIELADHIAVVVDHLGERIQSAGRVGRLAEEYGSAGPGGHNEG